MVRILDSTLREGEQTPGVCFPPHVKLAIARQLDAVGVDIIESGHPAVTPEIESAVRDVAHAGLRAVVGAHARSLDRDVDQALSCGVGFLGVFYCVSDARLGHHATSLGSAVEQVARVIARARERAPDLLIRYTPEDTVRSPFANVVAAAVAAVEAGADIISIADTTGWMMPGGPRSLYDYVLRLREALAAAGVEPLLAVHCHNDRGLALANALDAIRAGVDIVDVSVMGLGERAGIVDLGTLVTVMKADFDQGDFGQGERDLTRLGALYELVSRFSGVPLPVHFPVTGDNAFRHCAGVHSQAALANPLHYQSLDPALLGRRPTLSLDHMSGMAALQHALDALGEPIDDMVLRRRVLAAVKQAGQSGRIVDDLELRCIVDWCRGAGRTETPALEAAS
jgi:2-isopropylmalate synthase